MNEEVKQKEKDRTITEKIDQRTPHIRCSLPNPRTGEQCNEIMVLDPASKDFWRCPLCGSTLWPDERRQMELDERARAEEYEKRQLEIQKGRVNHDFFFLDHKSTMPVGGTLVPQVDHSKGGGGNKSGRKRKKKPSNTLTNTQN